MEKWLRKTEKMITVLLLLDALAWACLTLLPGDPFALQDTAEVTEIFESSVTARSDSGGLFGNISVETEDQVSVAAAKLLSNGEAAGNFSEGVLTVRVYPGDVLAIDGSAYQRRILFRLTAISSGIDSSYLPETLLTEGGVADWGVVVFK